MKCEKCRFYEFSTTLGSMHKEVWHCKCGFDPSNTCVPSAKYNEAITAGNMELAEFYRKWSLSGKMPNTQLELFNQ